MDSPKVLVTSKKRTWRRLVGANTLNRSTANVAIGDWLSNPDESPSRKTTAEVTQPTIDSFFHARISLITLPCTSVSRKQRPWNLSVRRS